MVENQPLEKPPSSPIQELKELYGDQSEIAKILDELQKILIEGEIEYIRKVLPMITLLAENIDMYYPNNSGPQIIKALIAICATYGPQSSEDAQQELDLKSLYPLMTKSYGEKYNAIVNCLSFNDLYALLNQIGPIADENYSPPNCIIQKI